MACVGPDLACAAAEAGEPALQQDAGEQDAGKRARALRKKLRQLEQLREKDPASLSDEQRSKLRGEDALQAELAALGVDGS